MQIQLMPAFHREVNPLDEKLIEPTNADNLALGHIIRDAVQPNLQIITIEKTAS